MAGNIVFLPYFINTKRKGGRKMAEIKEKYSMGNRLLVFTGSVLQLLPLLYWNMTAGKRPAYEVLYTKASFFPDYFIMLLTAAAAAVANCEINRRWVRKCSCLLYMSLCSTALFFLFVVGIFAKILFRNGVSAALAFLMLGGSLVFVYELAMGAVQAVTAVLFSGIIHSMVLLNNNIEKKKG